MNRPIAALVIFFSAYVCEMYLTPFLNFDARTHAHKYIHVVMVVVVYHKCFWSRESCSTEGLFRWTVKLLLLMFYFSFFLSISAIPKSSSVPICFSHFITILVLPVFSAEVHDPSCTRCDHLHIYEGNTTGGGNVGISVAVAHLLTLQNTGCVFQRYCLWVNVFLFLGLQSFTRTGTQWQIGVYIPVHAFLPHCAIRHVCRLRRRGKLNYWATSKSQEVLSKAMMVFCLSYLR